MRVIGIGNLILDYYFVDGKIEINGGGTVSNILANLSSMGIKTKICGYYGNDILGSLSKKLLEEAKVNTGLLVKKNYHTKCFFIDLQKTSSICPYCGKKYKNYKLKKDIKDFAEEDDIILIQDYTVLEDINNKICLDFGYYNHLLYEENEKIEKFIFRKYYIVSIKEEALFFILKKLKLTFQQFKEKINIYFLIITKGKKGVTIVFNDKEYNYKTKPYEEKETNGCGDIFFSTFISEILKRKNITKKDIDDIYYLAQNNVFTVVNTIGARNHIVKNKIITKNKKCICEDFSIKS